MSHRSTLLYQDNHYLQLNTRSVGPREGQNCCGPTRDPNILKSITVCVFRYMIDILVQVACKHFKDEIGNDPIVFLDSNRKETTHFEC